MSNSEPSPEDKRKLQLQDFSEISKLRNSYANMRLVALGTVLTLITGIVTFGKDIQDTSVFGIYAVLLLIVFTGIQVISAINRALYVFIEYLKSIEEKFKEEGFSSRWMKYEKLYGQDSGSYAFVVATHAINLVISVYILANSALQLLKDTTLCRDKAIAITLILIAIGLFIFNTDYIENQLNPKNFIEKIGERWEQAKQKPSEE